MFAEKEVVTVVYYVEYWGLSAITVYRLCTPLQGVPFWKLKISSNVQVLMHNLRDIEALFI